MEAANASPWEFEGVGPTLIRSLVMHCDARETASARDWGPGPDGPEGAQVRDIPGGTLVKAQNGKWGLGYLVGTDLYPVVWGTLVEVEAAADEVVRFGPPGGVGAALDAWDFEDDSLFRVSTAPMRGTFRIMIRHGGRGTLVFVRDDFHVVYLGADELDELKATADERLARRRDEILRVRIAGQILELNGYGRRGVIGQALVVYGGVRLMLAQVGPDRFGLYTVTPAGAHRLVGEYRGADLESGDLGEIHLLGPAQRGDGTTPPTATATAASPSMSSPTIEAPATATAAPAQTAQATAIAAPSSTNHAGGTRPPRTSPHQSRATHRAAAKTPSPRPSPPLPTPEDYAGLDTCLGRPQVPDRGDGVSELINLYIAFRVLVTRDDLENLLLSSPNWKKFIEANTTVRFGHRARTFLRAFVRFLTITGLGKKEGRKFRVFFGDLRQLGNSEVWATIRKRFPAKTEPQPTTATPSPAAPEAAAPSSTTSPAPAPATATATATASSTLSPATAAPSSTPPTATATAAPATSSTPPAVTAAPVVTAAAASPSMSSPAIEVPATATAVPALLSTPPTVTASASPSSTSSPATRSPSSTPPTVTVTAAATPPTVTAVAAPPCMLSPAIEAAILLSRLIDTPPTSHAPVSSVGPGVPGPGNSAVDHGRPGAAPSRMPPTATEAAAPSSTLPTVTAAASPPSMSSPVIEAPATATAVPALSSTPPTVTASASSSSTSSPATATPSSTPPIVTVTGAATPSTTPPTATAVAASPSMLSPAIEAAILLSRLIATPPTVHAPAPSVGPDVPGAGNPAVDHGRPGAATMYRGGLATDVHEADVETDLDNPTGARPRLSFLREEDRLKTVCDRSWASDAPKKFTGKIRDPTDK